MNRSLCTLTVSLFFMGSAFSMNSLAILPEEETEESFNIEKSSWLLQQATSVAVPQVYCVICECQREAFEKSKWIISRKNSYCPGCASKERQRHLWYFLITEKPAIFKRPTKVLYWAPSESISKKLATATSCTVVEADLYPQKATIQKEDITNISYADNSFDMIICSHVLEHVPDDHTAIGELYRITKPFGFTLILVPIYRDQESTYEDHSITDPEERLKHFDQKDHVRRYGPDIQDRLVQGGFTVQPFLLTRLSEQLRKILGLAGYDNKIKKDASRGADIYLCTK